MITLKSPAIGLALLVVLKIILDLRAHLRERGKILDTAANFGTGWNRRGIIHERVL